MKIRFDKIPQELQGLNQWVNWLPFKGKKMPLNPATGKPAQINNPATWGTFEQCKANITKYPDCGIMYALTSGIVAIDLDDCLDEAGQIEADAKAIITQFKPVSYIEKTPSGTGVHILTHGTKTGQRSRTGKIEIYDTSRFLTFTGIGIGFIGDGQAQINDLYNATFPPSTTTPVSATPSGVLDDEVKHIVDLASKAKHGDRFRCLWNGNWTLWVKQNGSTYHSQSEADLALAGMLRFWCKGDRELMLRCFMASGLYRPDQHHKASFAITKANDRDDTNFYRGK